MDIEGRGVVILGGTGLVGRAIARRLLELGPERLVVAGLRKEEADRAVQELKRLPSAHRVELVPEWGDIFLRRTQKERSRAELLAERATRGELVEDVFGPLDAEALGRSQLFAVLDRHRPQIVIDCINTATAIAYQDLFSAVVQLRRACAEDGKLAAEVFEAHLATLPLPQLIRHVQILLEALRRVEASMYVKIGTSGTGGMGLNVPFTHSEERPSASLLAKASVAGAHSLLLFLMGRTPGAPAVIEIKPTAAIAWKRIGVGPIHRGGRPIERFDATRPLPVERAFEQPEEAWRKSGDTIESIFLDAGENGLFSLSEFEVISSLGLMEVITPEEIARSAVDEILGRPTGHNVVAALDASTSGPTYRGGMLREAALTCMERLEAEHGIRSVAFEMLGPPRLSKLIFEAALLERLFESVEEAAELDPAATADAARKLIEEDARLRSDALSVGIPILLPDGRQLLRGPSVKVSPEEDGAVDVDRWAARGWVDLRPDSWVQWRERCRGFRDFYLRGPGAEEGSGSDLDVRAASGEMRAGALAAFVLRVEDGGARRKR
ncbi:MAG: short-chain dehydrogenase [Gemmatimonadota bacterium]